MGELFNELDQNDAEELNEAERGLPEAAQVVNDQGQVAFSKQEEMQFKAANAQSNAPATAQNAAVSANKLVPTANPFSKKRQHSEITKAEDPLASRNGNGNLAVVDEVNDIAMQDDFKSAAASDVKMQSAAESSHEAQSAVKGLDQHKSNAHLPNATSNIEEDWRRLKQQNSELNSEIRTVDATQAINS